MSLRRFAWPLFGLWAALAVTASVLQLSVGGILDALVPPALGVLAFVGALLSVRRPENPIGPILLALALLVTLGVIDEALYVPYDKDLHPPLLIRIAAALNDPLGNVWFVLIGILLPLLFPTGRLPSPRWRPVVLGSVAFMAVSVLAAACGPQRLDFGEHGGLRNPLAVPGTAGALLRALDDFTQAAFALVVLACLSGVFVRLRRSHGIERQQLKWIAYVFFVMLTGLAAAATGEWIGSDPLGNVGWSFFLAGVVFGMPVAIATAILRHHLYDIDVVIRRTLIYGALTLTLGAAYLGLVLLIGLTVGRSGFATAASTLAVAALFRPARARIQGVVDRRFYRSRYDAAQTLEAFGAHLRDELDLEALAADVRAVVRDTVQPAHVSLWLRGGR
jgi:hypothetical protein